MSYSKYYLYKKQYSNDSGATWYDVTPLEQVASGSPIATYDTLAECQGGGTDYSTKYLTFVALEDGTFKFSGNSISYSTDNGNTWSTLASNTNSPTINTGQKIMWKGTLSPSSNGIGRFSSTGQFDIEGNAMSLLFGDDFDGQTSFSGKSYAFTNLFSGCTGLVSVENMKLPATTLTYLCYGNMFRGCTSLTTVPSNYLPSTALSTSCYEEMFYGCTSLTAAPSLPATTMTNNCYQNMFRGCTSLTTAPELPATTLADFCYADMFRNCTSLTTAPVLGAATLVYFCYAHMLSYCRNLNNITCLATDISAESCTKEWVKGVQTTSGTFTKAASMSSWTTGINGIPTNWAVQNET